MEHKNRSEYFKKYNQKNKEKIAKQKKEYFQKNKKRRLAYGKRYRMLNREKRTEYMKKYMRNQRRKDLKFKLNYSVSNSIRQSLKNGKGGAHWEKLVGYCLDNLMRHLEKQFTPEMSWENHGYYWHIDHVIPISAFNFDNYNQLDFRRCWALNNLRPLEKHENLKKNDRIGGSFQPNLKI